jgi:methyl-accepting chemotaxis protein
MRRAMGSGEASAVTFSAASGQIGVVGLSAIAGPGGRQGYITVGKRFSQATLQRLSAAVQADVTVLYKGGIVASTIEGLAGDTSKSLPTETTGQVSISTARGDMFGSVGAVQLDGEGALSVVVTRPTSVIRDKFVSFVMWPAAGGGLALLLLTPIVLVAARRFAALIGDIAEAIRLIAGGDAALQVPHQQRADEIGDMARALVVFQQNNARVAEADRDRQMAAAQQAQRLTQLEGFQIDLQSVIDAASGGVFNRRLDMASAPPDLRGLAEAMNRLLADFESTIAATVQGMESIADGDLAARVRTDSSGDFERLTGAANTMAGRFQ